MNIDIIYKHVDEHYVLEKIYNINSFDKIINYIKNNTELPINTMERLIECAFYIYGETNNFPNQLINEEIQKILKIKHKADVSIDFINNVIIEHMFENKHISFIIEIIYKKYKSNI